MYCTQIIKGLTIILVLQWVYYSSWGQDVHFTQFFNSPLSLNPANTGNFDGRFRFATNNRNQWGSISAPFITSSFSLDSRFLKRKTGRDHAGVGLYVFQYMSGDVNLNNTEVMLSSSFIKVLDRKGQSKLSFGLQGGFFQRSIDLSKLKFADQYDYDAGDYTQATGEVISGFKVTKADFQAGITYLHNNPEKLLINSGLSFFHLTEPDASFIGTIDRIPLRSVAHSDVLVKITDKDYIGPQLLFMYMKRASEFTFGGIYKHVMDTESDIVISFGSYYRFQDALLLISEIEYDNWKVGISYDINVSRLHVASNHRGGFEISIIYIDKWLSGKDRTPFVVPCYRF
ncbi:MAG: hypothetical protein COC01_04880 [Bacteroidetes bacterium]|nr:PorP/SprF family type IX secretion system membrane protein [Sphingobacteriaceae bacterium AH-315-L07]PCH67906.1 MAG: hypothetical protein COC01_04880 [Bacteroidota bacterium]